MAFEQIAHNSERPVLSHHELMMRVTPIDTSDPMKDAWFEEEAKMFTGALFPAPDGNGSLPVLHERANPPQCSQHKKPCGDCIFRRDSEPGATGGSPIDVYIGQVEARMWIPCHCSKGYRAKGAHIGEEAECAGAATFRANLGIPVPPAMLAVEPDHEGVLSTYAEFVAHHKGISFQRAEAMVRNMPPHILARRELSDPAAKLMLVPN